MRALTLRQPFAWAVASGLKTIENRSWYPTLAPGELFAIHASAAPPSASDVEKVRSRLDRRVKLPPVLVRGAVVAVARVKGIWAYYDPKRLRVVCRKGATSSYSWGTKNVRFVRCNTCGCITHYERNRSPARRMAVNARNLDPAELRSARIRHLDGAATWKYLD